IAVANPAGLHANSELSRPRLRDLPLHDFEFSAGGGYLNSFHLRHSASPVGVVRLRNMSHQPVPQMLLRAHHCNVIAICSGRCHGAGDSLKAKSGLGPGRTQTMRDPAIVEEDLIEIASI